MTEEYVEEPPPPPPPGPPPREWWPWLLALALLVLGAIVGYVIFNNAGGDGGKTTVVTQAGTAVPAVVGLTETKASARLTETRLVPQIKRQTSEKAKDTVISQAPAAGARVDPGTVVTLIVSAGRAGVEVPDVVGLRTPAATAKLKAAGFTPKTTSVFSTKPAGTAIAQKPPAGDRAEKGAEVVVQVSKGRKDVQVPDVVGQPSADAQATLKQAGFAYTIIIVPADEPRGTVVSQDPPGGTTAQQGSKVRVNVSSGSGGGTGTTTGQTTGTAPAANVAVPRVVGMNQTAAQRRLQAVGLTSTVVYVASAQPAGRVVAQRPVPGTSVRRGSRVRLNVSTGPNPEASRAVPDVIGQDEATATTTLENAGFVVEVIDQPTTDQSQDGIVVDEQPVGGSRAPTGSVVTIYVGRFSG